MKDHIETLSEEGKNEYSTDAVSSSVPKFTQENDFTTFRAEYAFTEGNFCVHFFLPEDRMIGEIALPKNYWLEVFPDALNEVAPRHFQATAPRLVASYTEELKSWWMLARNYEHIMFQAQYMSDFFVKLDDCLDSKLLGKVKA